MHQLLPCKPLLHARETVTVHIPHAIVRIESYVRRRDHTGVPYELFIPLEVSFVLENVEEGIGDFAAYQSLEQRLGIDNFPPGGIHEDDAVAHFRDCFCIHEMFCLSGRRDVKSNDIAQRQQFRQRDVSYPQEIDKFESTALIDCEDGHPESMRDLRSSPTNFPGADDSEGFSPEGHSPEAMVVEFAAFDAFVAFVDVTQCSEEESKDVFGNHMGSVIRNIAYLHTPVFACYEVDMICANGTCTEESQFRKILQFLRPDLRVDEDGEDFRIPPSFIRFFLQCATQNTCRGKAPEYGCFVLR